ncbi:MAG: hypothetical protein MK364_02085, partial [Pirellulales bacterium]|nr:hypothetical protein [Pirellulales bacterium]
MAIFLSSAIAVSRKIRLPQIIGVPHPLPSTEVFQRKFSVSLQVIGGSACNATPFQVGPRHCGQYFRASSAMSRAENIITNSTATIVVIMRRFIEIYSSLIFSVQNALPLNN